MRLNLGLLEAGARSGDWQAGRAAVRDGRVTRLARLGGADNESDGYEVTVEEPRTKTPHHVVLHIDFGTATAVLEEWSCTCPQGDGVCEHSIAAALQVREVLGRSDSDDESADAGWQVLLQRGREHHHVGRSSWVCYDLTFHPADNETQIQVVRRRRTMGERGSRGGTVLGWTPAPVGTHGYRTSADPAKNRDDLVPVLCVVNRHDLRVRTLQPGFVDVFLRLFVAAEPYVLRVDGDDARVEPHERPVTVTIDDASDGGLEIRARLQSFSGAQDDDILPLPGPVPWLYLRGERALVRPRASTPLLLELLRRRRVHVPSDEVEAFCREVLPQLRSESDLRERSARLPPVRTAAPECHVLLDEVDDALSVGLRFAYPAPPGVEDDQSDAAGDPDIQRDAAGGYLMAPFAGPRIYARRLSADGSPVLWHRDDAFEHEWIQRLADIVHTTPPATLAVDAALDFLQEHVPALEAAGARVFGRDGLMRLRPHAHGVSTHVRLASGVDWFGLRIELRAGDVVLPLDAVLQAWRRGHRHLRLESGELVRLPTAWLQRHLGALQDLRDLGQQREDGTFEVAPHLVPALAGLAAESEASDARWQDLLRALGTFGGVEPRPLPEGLRADLRSYQQHGYDWLCALRDLRFGGCLADDMGLGKTVQALTLLLAEVEQGRATGRPTLVVAPTSVVQNWLDEAARFAPTLKALRLGGEDRALRQASLAAIRDHDLVVTSYALVRQDAEALSACEFHYVVLDEAQAIKNPNSQTARITRGLRARHRLTLTGTPIENNLLELWSQLEFLMPGFFGSRARFVRRYGALGPDNRREGSAEELRERLRPFVLRRLKADVDKELPPITEMTLRCQLGPSQRELYERVRNTYRARVLAMVEEVGLERSRLGVLEALLRLRQAACHPDLLPFEEARRVDESAKTRMFMRTLSELLQEGRRVLVFSQWTSMLRILRSELDDLGVEYDYLDGSTRDRAAVIEHFQRPDGPRVFLLSLKAGGVGLNLTAADTVIHYDPWWNPAAEQQARDRAHRIGQTRPVLVLRLVAEDTVEEMIVALQERKRDLMRAAIESEADGVKALDRDDLLRIFGGGGEGLKRPVAWREAREEAPWDGDDDDAASS